VRELRPDVVTLDVVMPDMDGLTALKLIMRDTPTPVVMVSMSTYDGAWETLEALALGAVDFITKPSGPISLDIAGRRTELIEKVRLAYAARHKVAGGVGRTLASRDLRQDRGGDATDLQKVTTGPLAPKSTTGPLAPKPTTGPLAPKSTTGMLTPKPTTGMLTPKPTTGMLTPRRTTGPLTLKRTTGPLGTVSPAIAGPQRELPLGQKRLVAIAASTGGPAALQELLARLPADLNAGVVIVQHIASGFTRPLAELLHSLSPMDVIEATDGARIVPGVALLAPAGLHVRVVRVGEGYAVQLSPEPAAARHRPSADVLFRSVAHCCAADACAVLLTGMGEDGALGLRSVYEAGGWTVAQDEATSVVWGMPRRAVELGAVRALLALEEIAAEIIRATRP
jgi:two-component system, chemotaxis family, protein-glutamate methylesterase/glutaminase